MTAKNPYETITAKIVEEMEAGRLPWVKEWDAGNVPSRPTNASTGAAYNGVNILMLWGALFEGGYGVNAWMTYKQAQSMGGQVRKGEKGTQIVKLVTFEPKEAKERAAETGEDARQISRLRAYTVFNIEQIDGLPDDLYAPSEIIPLPVRHARAEALITATEADFRIGGREACYIPALDVVRIPPINSFVNEATYYATALHELVHWTGAKKRLDAGFGSKGSNPYAIEELRAELGAAFLCADLGIKPINRHADYLSKYIKALKEEPRYLFKIASAASAAANFLLDFETPAEALDAA